MPPAPPSHTPDHPAALLALPGWDDHGRQQFDALDASLQPSGWICRRANIPDADWPAEARARETREDSLARVLEDYMNLVAVRGVARSRLALLGFSYGAYMACFLAAAKPARLLVLRCPALYPDDDWTVPKEELDKRELGAYRARVHGPAQNKALDCCARFEGEVLLIDSECDQVIAPTVIASYERSFVHARSLTRLTLEGADHQLSEPRWQQQYHAAVVDWLAARL